MVNQTGGDPGSIPSDTRWSGQASLDVEWAHALAPQARIVLVETNDANGASLGTGVEYARHLAGVSTVCLSWRDASPNIALPAAAGQPGAGVQPAKSRLGEFEPRRHK